MFWDKKPNWVKIKNFSSTIRTLKVPQHIHQHNNNTWNVSLRYYFDSESDDGWLRIFQYLLGLWAPNRPNFFNLISFWHWKWFLTAWKCLSVYIQKIFGSYLFIHFRPTYSILFLTLKMHYFFREINRKLHIVTLCKMYSHITFLFTGQVFKRGK